MPLARAKGAQDRVIYSQTMKVATSMLKIKKLALPRVNKMYLRTKDKNTTMMISNGTIFYSDEKDG